MSPTSGYPQFHQNWLFQLLPHVSPSGHRQFHQYWLLQLLLQKSPINCYSKFNQSWLLHLLPHVPPSGYRQYWLLQLLPQQFLPSGYSPFHQSWLLQLLPQVLPPRLLRRFHRLVEIMRINTFWKCCCFSENVLHCWSPKFPTGGYSQFYRFDPQSLTYLKMTVTLSWSL